MLYFYGRFFTRILTDTENPDLLASGQGIKTLQMLQLLESLFLSIRSSDIEKIEINMQTQVI